MDKRSALLAKAEELKHSVFKLSGNIAREREDYTKRLNKLRREFNKKTKKDLKNLSKIIREAFEVIDLILEKEAKNGKSKKDT